jgi:soluble lytic murein transglycosylase-like protein
MNINSEKRMAPKTCRIFVFIGLFLMSTRIFAGDTSEAVQDSSHNSFKVDLLQFKTPDNLTLFGEHVPLERRDVWERLDKQFLLALSRKAQVILWLKRSKKHFPFIEERLKNYNLPDDIKYLAVAESDLNNYALSPKGAAGTWQFMKYTGRRFGLKKKRWLDERYSFPKATEAALTYLISLHEQFGQWRLAIAAYNCGENRLKNEIAEQKTEDFFDLYLPKETEEYLLRIMAIKIILSNPEKYGFVLDEHDYYVPYDVEEVEVSSPGLVHIRIIAEAAKTNFKTIKGLNPELKGYYLHEGSYTLFVPRNSREGFSERLKASLDRVDQGTKAFYRVKEGDSLSQIAFKLDIPMKQLMKWNTIGKSAVIYPGQKILYYKRVWK